MKDHREFHVAFASDQGYALQLKVSVGSLLHALRRETREIVVDVLDDGIQDGTWRELMACWAEIRPGARILRHKITSVSFASYRSWKGSKTAYVRLLLPELLQNVDWCLYADCDTFFLQSPLVLWDGLDEEKAIVGHVIPPDRSLSLDIAWLKARGYVLASENYVCSGFLMMNLNAFRAKGISGKCREFLDCNPDSLTADQCALNVACEGVIGKMASGWGVFVDEALKLDSVGCVHFAGVVPWTQKRSPFYYASEYNVFRLWFWFARVACHERNFEVYVPCGRFVSEAIWRAMNLALRFLAWLPACPRCFKKQVESVRLRFVTRSPQRMWESLR